MLGLRHRQVTWQQVIKRRDVRGTLNGRVPPERHNSTARPPDVAEQQLNDRRRPDILHAHRMLGPADRVTESAGFVPAGIVAERFRHLEEQVFRNTAGRFDDLGRVAGEMPLQDLEHAFRMLQARIGVPGLDGLALDRFVFSAGLRFALTRGGFGIDIFVHPCPGVVAALFLLPAAEQAVQVLGIAELIANDRRRIRVVDNVVLEIALVLDDVTDDAAQERDIGSGTDRYMNVSNGAGARESRVHVNNCGPTLTSFHHPAECYRMALRHVGSLNDDEVGVLQVPRKRGRAASSE